MPSLVLLSILLSANPALTPQARLLDESARITAEMPSIHLYGAMTTTGLTFLLGGGSLALAAGLSGTGHVVAMTVFLVLIPGAIAVVGAALFTIGLIGFTNTIKTRHLLQHRLGLIEMELQMLGPAPDPAAPPPPQLEVLTF